MTSKNSNYAAAESYLTFQHNEYTGLPILDEKGRPKLRDSYLLDTLECGESSFAMACLIANCKYSKNGRQEDVKTYHIWRHPPKRMLIYPCVARTASHTKYIISFDPKDAAENGLTMEKAQALGLQFCKDNFPGHPAIVCTHPDGHNSAGNIHTRPFPRRKTDSTSITSKHSRSCVNSAPHNRTWKPFSARKSAATPYRSRRSNEQHSDGSMCE